jgi:hypothetical protein
VTNGHASTLDEGQVSRQLDEGDIGGLSGYEVTREAAMAAFAKSWRRK